MCKSYRKCSEKLEHVRTSEHYYKMPEPSILEDLEKFREGERRPLDVMWRLVQILMLFNVFIWTLLWLWKPTTKNFQFSTHCMKYEDGIGVKVVGDTIEYKSVGEDCWKHPERYPVHEVTVTYDGTASWYDYSLKGYPNYSKENFTAASRDFPKGTKLRVCREIEEKDLECKGNSCKNISGKEILVTGIKGHYDIQGKICVDVRVNDYGPEEWTGRKIDLSSKAFSQLAPLSKGLIEVSIEELKRPN